MVTKYFFVLLLISSSYGSTVLAQSPEMEAKAAYLLAEESFEAGKYEECVNYLNQATERLGVANAKILYLQILSLSELTKTDYNFVAKLKGAIEAFTNAPDISSFNEEKKLEIMKLKLKMAVLRPLTSLEEKVYQLLKLKNWRINASLKEMQEAHPDMIKPQPFGHLASDGKNSIFFYNEKVAEIFHMWYTYNNIEDSSCSKGTAVLRDVIQALGSEVKRTSEVKRSTEKKLEVVNTRETYSWQDDMIQVFFTYTNRKIVSTKTGDLSCAFSIGDFRIVSVKQ